MDIKPIYHATNTPGVFRSVKGWHISSLDGRYIERFAYESFGQACSARQARNAVRKLRIAGG